jgi:hypothetical protein
MPTMAPANNYTAPAPTAAPQPVAPAAGSPVAPASAAYTGEAVKMTVGGAGVLAVVVAMLAL